MKKVISTKVDQSTYAEFLEYCARNNKYPANALREALELLLSLDKTSAEQRPPTESKQRTAVTEPTERKRGTDIDEDEEDLFG